ncbi:unnamed protein product, partial [marine sediment metagenome]
GKVPPSLIMKSDTALCLEKKAMRGDGTGRTAPKTR